MLAGVSVEASDTFGASEFCRQECRRSGVNRTRARSRPSQVVEFDSSDFRRPPFLSGFVRFSSVAFPLLVGVSVEGADTFGGSEFCRQECRRSEVNRTRARSRLSQVVEFDSSDFRRPPFLSGFVRFSSAEFPLLVGVSVEGADTFGASGFCRQECRRSKAALGSRGCIGSSFYFQNSRGDGTSAVISQEFVSAGKASSPGLSSRGSRGGEGFLCETPLHPFRVTL